MTDVLRQDVVAQADASALDTEAVAVETVPGSVTNQDFAITFVDGRRALIKTGPADQLLTEVWALTRAAEAQIDVPIVLTYVDRAAELPVPYLMLSWLADERPPNAAALRSAGRAIRVAHSIPLEGFGPMLITGAPDRPESARGAFASWAEFGQSLLDDLDCVLGAGLLGRAESAELRDLAANFEASALAGGSSVLLHGDLKAQHVLAVGDRLSGVIDWGDAQAGDPAWDLARASMMEEEEFAAFLDGYGLELTPDLAEQLRVYRMLWNVRSLSYEYQAGGDWFAAYQDRISADLPEQS